MTEQATQLA